MSTAVQREHRRRIIRRLGEHLEEIGSFVRDVDPALLRRRPDPAKWSIHEQLMHLAEVQDVFTERIAQILMQDAPRIEPFVPDEARTRGSYLGRSLEEGLGALRSQREHLLTLLGTLDDTQWLREGEHPELRHYTVELCAEALMRHEEHHLYAVFIMFFGPGE